MGKVGIVTLSVLCGLSTRVFCSTAAANANDFFNVTNLEGFAFSPVPGNKSGYTNSTEGTECRLDNAGPLPVAKRKTCCRRIYTDFKKRWDRSPTSLSSHMQLLKQWQCPVFEKECSRKTFAFNEFTELVYLRFCNETRFIARCRQELSDNLGIDIEELLLMDFKIPFSGSGIQPESEDTVHQLKELLSSGGIPLTKLTNPCVQAALAGDVKSYEIKVTAVPYCELHWCSFPEYYFQENMIMDSTCLPQRCKSSLFSVMTATAILGLLIVICNVFVLVVFSFNPRLRSSQGIYKISLAVSDIMVGVFVCPLSIEGLRKTFMSTYYLKEAESAVGHNITVPEVTRYSSEFLGFSGIVTTLSLSTSINTLMVAGFDRLMLVYKPLEYDPHNAKAVAKKLIAGLWALGLAISLLPYVVHDLDYFYAASALAIFMGQPALIIYVINFALPLVLIWAATAATLIYCKKNSVEHIRLNKANAVKRVRVEIRLAKTLAVMVGVFTVCLLPAAGVAVAELVVEGLDYSNPAELNREILGLFESLENATALILLSNSLWNFFIYSIRSREFRKTCIAIYLRVIRGIKECKCRGDQKDAYMLSHSNSQNLRSHFSSQYSGTGV